MKARLIVLAAVVGITCACALAVPAVARAAKQNGGTGCQAGYAPCLPRVADLNCSDFPASKRPVRVTGSDPCRLDADGDGVACEG